MNPLPLLRLLANGSGRGLRAEDSSAVGDDADHLLRGCRPAADQHSRRGDPGEGEEGPSPETGESAGGS